MAHSFNLAFPQIVLYEPQYSVARIMVAKVVAILTVIDDTYDAYGTIEELQLFTDAVQKWNVEEIHHLPNDIKICYRALLDLFDDFEEDFKEDGKSYALSTSKEAIKQIIHCYFVEAKWFIEEKSPPFAEYLRNGIITAGFYVLTPISYLGMNVAIEEALSWLSQNPQIIRSGSIIARLVDDVSTHEVEKQRGQVTTPIECYMKELGVTKEEAFLKFKEMAEDAWKELNEERIKSAQIPWKFLSPVVNLARFIEVVYKFDEDGFTNPGKGFKYHIASMIIDPVPI